MQTRQGLTGDSRGTTGLRAVRPPSLQEVVEERLVEAIIDGQWRDNERLTEVELADRLGVSRSPMRSAMHQLVVDGLLVRSEPRGVRVAPLSAESAREFYDCRILLEGHCAFLAAGELTDAQIAQAERLLGELESAYDNQQPAAWLAVVEQLHDIYRAACPNQELVTIIHGLGRRTLRLRAIGISRTGRMTHSLSTHTAIVSAMRARDSVALQRAVTDLLTTSRDGIVDAIKDLQNAAVSGPNSDDTSRDTSVAR